MQLIDIHSHFLYGMDDGAQTVQEMKAMIRIAVENKVTHMVATSHAYTDKQYFDMEKYQRQLKSAQEWCEAEHLSIHLYRGAEIYYSDYVADQLRRGLLPTIAGSKYVLVEFSPKIKEYQLVEAIRKVSNAGYKVIIAHVERYECSKNTELFRRLSEYYDAVVQVNCLMFLEKMPRRLVRWRDEMIRDDLIDIVASDAHDTEDGRCRMKSCFKALNEEYGREIALALTRKNVQKLIFDH